MQIDANFFAFNFPALYTLMQGIPKTFSYGVNIFLFKVGTSTTLVFLFIIGKKCGGFRVLKEHLNYIY